MSQFLKNILDGINTVFGNYGWSIIIFTLLIKLVLMPFDYKSRVSMRKTTKIQPQLTALQKKYANDKEKLNAKTAELYKKEGINPLSSCLPMLLTFPILIAMFNAMRLVANEQMVQQVFSILQNQEPVLEGWLWVKNLWMPDSPFAACWPDLSSLQQIPADVWQRAIAALPAETLDIIVGAVESATGTVIRSSSISLMKLMPARVRPHRTATRISFQITRKKSRNSISFRDSPRMMETLACDPELPPVSISIGI